MAELQLRLPNDVQPRARHVSITERMSRPFDIAVWIDSNDTQMDLDALIAQPVSLQFAAGLAHASDAGRRHYHGVCVGAEQIKGEQQGITRYVLALAPRFALLGERHDYRHFQHRSVVDIARALFEEWDVDHDVRLEAADYPPLEMRVQYGESDLAFVERLLEEEGISYYFESDADKTKVILDDAPHSREPRSPALPHVDNPNEAAEREYVTGLAYARNLRAGRYRVRAQDFRHPTHELAKDAGDDTGRFEHYNYRPGSFHSSGHSGGDTPAADDRGAVRADDGRGSRLARVGLEREQSERDAVRFSTNAFDLTSGRLFTLHGHPRPDLDQDYLIREANMELSDISESIVHGEAVPESRPFRPARRHGTRRVHGLVTATVVGRPGKEIDTDEFGRVRVKFHWDRASAADHTSSAWIRVCQSWAGGSYGSMLLPRIGQEVVVGFVGGNPDEPLVMGRLYNAANPPPYELPKHSARSTWKSSSTPGGNGSNEIRFDDTSGREEVYVHAENNLNTVVENDERRNVGHDRETSIGADETLRVGGHVFRHVHAAEAHENEDQVIRLAKSEQITTKERFIHTVEGHRHLRSGATFEEARTVERTVWEMVKDKSMGLHVIDAFVGLHLLSNLSVRVDGNWVDVLGKERICLKVGNSSVVLGPDEITINSPSVRINTPGDGPPPMRFHSETPMQETLVAATPQQLFPDEFQSSPSKAEGASDKTEDGNTASKAPDGGGTPGKSGGA